MGRPSSRPSLDPAQEIVRGRDAYARRALVEAHGLLSSADRTSPLGPEDLGLLATAAYLIGREEESLELLERAHVAHLENDEPLRAVRPAFWIGFQLVGRGEIARATGWFGRAGRLVEREGGDCVERGYLLLPMVHQKLAAGEAAVARAAAERAAAIAERFGDAELLALALHLVGTSALGQGHIEEGLALLDESMVAVATDSLSPIVTGMIYCGMIGACRRIYELGRVQEWTAVLAEWCERQPEMVVHSGECLVYRAEILQMRGQWSEAIGEARRAWEQLARRSDSRMAAAALYRQGEIHRLLGEFASAQEAYRRAGSAGWEPQPGLALLRLAQNDAAAAAASIRRVLGETRDPLQRGRLLPAYAEIMLAEGSIDEARDACAELERLAGCCAPTVPATMAAHARGAIDLAAGDAEAALPALREALRGWQALQAPYEAARVRVLLGTACRALRDEDAAALELEAARAVFEALGAAPDVARVAPLLRAGVRPSAAGTGALTPRERQVLALLATGKTNRAIAADLRISEKTVARHVSNLFAKLGLSSRSAATAYAYEHGVRRAHT